MFRNSRAPPWVSIAFPRELAPTSKWFHFSPLGRTTRYGATSRGNTGQTVTGDLDCTPVQ